MKTRIQSVISILKVVQDHIAEIKAQPAKNETTASLLDDVELGVGWVLRKLEKLHAANEIAAGGSG